MRRLAVIAILVSVAATSSLADQDVVLSIDITQPPGEPYEDAIAIIKSAGATATSLSLFWDELETAPGKYAPEIDWPSIANAYYPSEDMALTLTFSVIDTFADRRRADLTNLSWDDPSVLDAFANHLDDVISRMPDVEILTVSIGNEIGGLLQTPAEIEAFSRFVAAARKTLEEISPGTTVGTKLTYAALSVEPDRWQPVLDVNSALHVTYYPLSEGFVVRPDLDVADDLANLDALSNGMPIYILEAGYPSDGCGAASDGQAAFVRELVAIAALMSNRVRLVSLTWLTDIPDAELDTFQQYYGVQDPCFRRYIASIGLRAQNGDPKPALQWLQ